MIAEGAETVIDRLSGICLAGLRYVVGGFGARRGATVLLTLEARP